jgi:hypothetical protein
MVIEYEPDGQDATLVTAESVLLGNIHKMSIPLPMEDFESAYRRFEAGEHVQNAFPTLNPDEREFILTGMTPEEWDKTFGEE